MRAASLFFRLHLCFLPKNNFVWTMPKLCGQATAPLSCVTFLQAGADRTYRWSISASALTRCQWRRRAAAGPLIHLTTSPQLYKITQLQQPPRITTTQAMEMMSKKTITWVIIEKKGAVVLSGMHVGTWEQSSSPSNFRLEWWWANRLNLRQWCALSDINQCSASASVSGVSAETIALLCVSAIMCKR